MNLPFTGGRLARYRIIDRLGAGGMGEVYRARDEQLDRDVAIKVLPASSFEDPMARARMLQEARAAAALNHPYICTVYEVGEASGQTYIAMELVDGQTLGTLLEAGGLPAEQVVRYGTQLADAVAHAHERSVVHRDLKSANIIVRPDGRVKVLDFGLAKRLTSTDLTAAITRDVASLTQPGAVMGTVAYMAPEQLRGEPAQMPSDIWALGIVLHEMAAGKRPFDGQTGFELSAAILGEAPTPLPAGMGQSLRTVVGRCLEKDPARRFTGSEVLRALETLEDARPVVKTPIANWETPTLDTFPPGVVASPPTEASERVQPSGTGLSRRRAIWLGTATALGLVAAFVGWFVLSDTPEVRSLAVLPFENVLNDEETDYLSGGLAESLIRQVSRLPSVSVSPLSAVLNFKGQAVEPSEAGRQLGAEIVLASTFSLQEDLLVITSELVDVESGGQLWNQIYERDATELLDIQDAIARAILNDGLRVELSDEEQSDLVRNPTVDVEAYNSYLQARWLQRRATEDDYLEAIELLKGATIRDPEFARAFLMLAGTFEALVIDGYMQPNDGWPQANTYLRRAETIDPDMPDLDMIRHGQAFFNDWDFEGAERYREAGQNIPAGQFDPDGLRIFSLELLARGETGEALDLARQARALDPLSIGLAILQADYLVHNGQFDVAVEVYNQAIAAEPDNPDAFFGLAQAYVEQGLFKEASQARSRALALLGDPELAELFAAAEGEEGYRNADLADVQWQLDFMKSRVQYVYVSPLSFAGAYAQLGDTEQAFIYLEEAFDERSPGLVLMTFDAALDNIRDDPRFDDLLRRVGFPSSQ